MITITSPEEMQRRSFAAKSEGRVVALVPTMGFLHEGHLSLLKEGRKKGDLLVLSIFVNPAQFGQGEDFDDYPRDLERDSVLAEAAGVDIIFAPTASSMYPQGYKTYIDVEDITEPLCGASRPGHFKGVSTVVSKLFHIVQPQIAFFGDKDFQQLAVIRRMVIDLNMPVEIVGMQIYREKDGLALSSRNVYLTVDQRNQALALSRSLDAARQAVAAGEKDAVILLGYVRSIIADQPLARIDYAHICHQLSLKDQEQVDQDSVLLLAVFFGQTRLIDNGFLMVS